MERAGLAAALRRGLVVIIVLAVLTAVEFAVAAEVGRHAALGPLIIMALAKAGLIVYYFMHVSQLWRQEE